MHQPPSYPLLASELPRSGFETARTLFELRQLVKDAPRGDNQPVLTIPGYGGGDATLLILRYYLEKIGYRPYALGLGINYESANERIKRVEDAVAFRKKMVEKVIDRAAAIHRETGEPVSLIGWSMGGLYAFDVAQEQPDIIRQVITLAAPYGDPRGTSMFKLLRFINRSVVPLEEQDFDSWNNRRQLQHDKVPVHVLFSNRDGIVSPAIAKLDEHPAVQHHEIDSSHTGFTVNPEALRKIAELLQRR